MFWRLVALIFLLLPSLAAAQTSTLPGFPPGAFMSRAALDPAVSAPSFSGSGNTLASAYAYWSCARAYTAAYASGGGNACDIIRASDSATCTTKFASTGFLDVTTAYCNSNTQSVTAFCTATTCKVTKAYDQSGATNCGVTVACDATQSTDANRPVLNLSGLSGKVCMTFAGGQSLVTLTTNLNQPMSMSAIAERTGATTSFNDILGLDTNVQFLFNAAANQAGIYAGNVGAAQAVSASDNAYHAFQMVLNGASSIVVVDGSATTGLNPGANTLANPITIGNANNPLNGSFCEGRLDNTAYNATQYGNLNSNQHGTSGYNF